jgi:hypothetical protein
MVGLPGLHQSAPGLIAAPRPSRDLLQQLEGALGGARITRG